MNIILSIIGWVAWAFSVYLALTFVFGCRRMVRSGQSFQWATAVQAFFWWIVAIVFLFTPFNKLHILWLLPVLFFSAQFLVLAHIPVLSPVILFFTQVFMKLVLLGTNAATQSSSIVWQRFLNEIEENGESAEKLKQVIPTFLTPDRISPIKFRANWMFLSNLGTTLLLGDDEDINPTPSLGRYDVLDWPLGYPKWFIAAYPDVASWATDRAMEDESFILNTCGIVSEDELLDSDGHIKGRYLRALIDTYRKKTGRTLECSE